jgi:hypothetical protein
LKAMLSGATIGSGAFWRSGLARGFFNPLLFGVRRCPRQQSRCCSEPFAQARWQQFSCCVRAFGPWIEGLEIRLHRKLPRSYRSLVTRYIFPSFDLRGGTLFGSTVARLESDLDVAIFSDRDLSTTLLKCRYIQSGRPGTGSYDPICIDCIESRQNHEYPTVRIDHEGVLCDSRTAVRKRIADSFIDFVWVISE